MPIWRSQLEIARSDRTGFDLGQSQSAAAEVKFYCGWPNVVQYQISKKPLASASFETPPIIVICGSMAHFSRMLQLQRQLRLYGIESVAPEDERHLAALSLSESDYAKMKRRMSERYFRIIRRRNVFGILVANFEKHGRPNYIGPNSLAEIAIAVNAKKKIYLAQDIYPELRDELVAWEAFSLRGDLTPLVHDLEKATPSEQQQLSLDLPDVP